MAKRAAPDEQPFRPLLDASLLSAAISNQPTQSTSAIPANFHKVLDLPRSEPSRTVETPKTEREEFAPKGIEPSDRGRGMQPILEKLDQEKRILFTRNEAQSIDRLVTSLATRLNAQIKVSHVARAFFALLLNAESELDKRAGEVPPLVRPPNGDAQAMQRFEHQIASIIGAALRDAGPLR